MSDRTDDSPAEHPVSEPRRQPPLQPEPPTSPPQGPARAGAPRPAPAPTASEPASTSSGNAPQGAARRRSSDPPPLLEATARGGVSSSVLLAAGDSEQSGSSAARRTSLNSNSAGSTAVFISRSSTQNLSGDVLPPSPRAATAASRSGSRRPSNVACASSPRNSTPPPAVIVPTGPVRIASVDAAPEATTPEGGPRRRRASGMSVGTRTATPASSTDVPLAAGPSVRSQPAEDGDPPPSLSIGLLPSYGVTSSAQHSTRSTPRNMLASTTAPPETPRENSHDHTTGTATSSTAAPGSQPHETPLQTTATSPLPPAATSGNASPVASSPSNATEGSPGASPTGRSKRVTIAPEPEPPREEVLLAIGGAQPTSNGSFGQPTDAGLELDGSGASRRNDGTSPVLVPPAAGGGVAAVTSDDGEDRPFADWPTGPDGGSPAGSPTEQTLILSLRRPTGFVPGEAEKIRALLDSKRRAAGRRRPSAVPPPGSGGDAGSPSGSPAGATLSPMSRSPANRRLSSVRRRNRGAGGESSPGQSPLAAGFTLPGALGSAEGVQPAASGRAAILALRALSLAPAPHLTSGSSNSTISGPLSQSANASIAHTPLNGVGAVSSGGALSGVPPAGSRDLTSPDAVFAPWATGDDDGGDSRLHTHGPPSSLSLRRDSLSNSSVRRSSHQGSERFTPIGRRLSGAFAGVRAAGFSSQAPTPQARAGSITSAGQSATGLGPSGMMYSSPFARPSGSGTNPYVFANMMSPTASIGQPHSRRVSAMSYGGVGSPNTVGLIQLHGHHHGAHAGDDASTANHSPLHLDLAMSQLTARCSTVSAISGPIIDPAYPREAVERGDIAPPLPAGTGPGKSGLGVTAVVPGVLYIGSRRQVFAAFDGPTRRRLSSSSTDAALTNGLSRPGNGSQQLQPSDVGSPLWPDGAAQAQMASPHPRASPARRESESSLASPTLGKRQSNSTVGGDTEAGSLARQSSQHSAASAGSHSAFNDNASQHSAGNNAARSRRESFSVSDTRRSSVSHHSRSSVADGGSPRNLGLSPHGSQARIDLSHDNSLMNNTTNSGLQRYPSGSQLLGANPQPLTAALINNTSLGPCSASGHASPMSGGRLCQFTLAGGGFLCVAKELAVEPFPTGAENACFLPLADTADTRIVDKLPAVFTFVNENAKHGHPVVLYCQKGRSRSVSFAVCYLMWRHRLKDYQSALALLRAAYSDADPNTSFLLQLSALTLDTLDACAGGPPNAVLPAGAGFGVANALQWGAGALPPMGHRRASQSSGPSRRASAFGGGMTDASGSTQRTPLSANTNGITSGSAAATTSNSSAPHSPPPDRRNTMSPNNRDLPFQLPLHSHHVAGSSAKVVAALRSGAVGASPQQQHTQPSSSTPQQGRRASSSPRASEAATPTRATGSIPSDPDADEDEPLHHGDPSRRLSGGSAVSSLSASPRAAEVRAAAAAAAAAAQAAADGEHDGNPEHGLVSASNAPIGITMTEASPSAWSLRDAGGF